MPARPSANGQLQRRSDAECLALVSVCKALVFDMPPRALDGDPARCRRSFHVFKVCCIFSLRRSFCPVSVPPSEILNGIRRIQPTVHSVLNAPLPQMFCPDVRDLRPYVYIVHPPLVPPAYPRPHALAVPFHSCHHARLSQARSPQPQLRRHELRCVLRSTPAVCLLHQAQKSTDR